MLYGIMILLIIECSLVERDLYRKKEETILIIDDLTNKNDLLVKENEEMRKEIEKLLSVENQVKQEEKEEEYEYENEYEKERDDYILRSLDNQNKKYRELIKTLNNIECQVCALETKVEQSSEAKMKTNIDNLEKRINNIELYVTEIRKLIISSDIGPCYEVNNYNNFFEGFEYIENNTLQTEN